MAEHEPGQEGQRTTAAAAWMPQPRIPKYSGEEGWQEFADEAERVLEAYDLPPKIAVEFLLRSLEGQARKEVLSMAKGDRDSPDKVLAHLKDIFGEKRSKVSLLEDFNQRRQLPGESALTFCHALQDLAAKANVRAAGAVSEKDLRDRFIERLANPALRRELRRRRAAKEDIILKEVTQEAMRWQEEEDDEAATRVESQQMSSVPSESLEDRLTSMMAGMLRDFEDRVNNKIAASTPAAPSSNRRACYHCGVVGHFKRECPKLKSGN